MIKKAQATLEFVLVFIIAAVLIMGLLRLWKWSKDNIDLRQGAYESSRLMAGKIASPGQPEVPYDATATPMTDERIFLHR
jgi:hypothetical protein